MPNYSSDAHSVFFYCLLFKTNFCIHIMKLLTNVSAHSMAVISLEPFIT